MTDLENDIEETKVKRAIWDLERDKVPGLDGFPIFFFRKYWKTMKEDLMNLMNEITERKTRLDQLNYANIVLIPRKLENKEIGDFRPITLVNSAMKTLQKYGLLDLAPNYNV